MTGTGLGPALAGVLSDAGFEYGFRAELPGIEPFQKIVWPTDTRKVLMASTSSLERNGGTETAERVDAVANDLNEARQTAIFNQDSE